MKKVEAYAQYYLAKFRHDVEIKREAFVAAEKRLVIAETEYANGKMVTGEPDGVSAILRGLLK